MEKRIGTTKETAFKLGMTPRAFLQLREIPGFPRPVIERGHHLWWDMKAIDLFLDNRGNIKPQSANHSAIIKTRLAKYGNVQSGIPC